MSAVSVTIGADTSQFDAAVKGLPEKVNRASAGMARAGGGGGFRNLGLMSQQVQDIAVQVQMGTRMSTIIAQQGSQIASIFGPSGMILGGIVAVGGALYSAQQAGDAMFESLKAESADFDKNLRKLSAGGIVDMISGMEDMQKRAAELRKELAASSEDTTWNNITNPIARFFSKSTFDASSGNWTNRQDAEAAAKAELATKAEEGRMKLIDEIITASDEELKILQLKADRQHEAAKALEVQVRLRKELAKIEQAPEEVRSRLQQNARARAELESGGGSNTLSRTLDLFSSKFQMAAGPVMQAVKQQLTEQAGQLTKNAGDLGRAAFSPLRGDMDISTGRGSNINTLRSSASEQIQQMMKQSALLKSQADKIERSNSLLADIAAGVKAFNPKLSYN